jgi:multiple sugar transport system substrate-binding protein
VSRNWARDFYDNSLLSDMAPYQEMTPDLAAETFLPGSLIQAQKGNVQYGIPGEGPDSLQVFYNMGMFEEAGVDPSPDAVKSWTWDDFVANAKTMTKYDGDQVDVAGFLVGIPTPGDATAAWAGCHGGSFYRDEQKGVAFNDNDAMVHGLEWWLRMLYEEKVSPDISPERPDRETFMQKKAAMVLDGPWSYSTVQEGAPDIRLGAMILPAWPGEGGKPSTGIWNNMLAIPVKAAHPDAGWTFLTWWCGLDFMLKRLEIGNWLAPRKDFYETPEFKAKFEENPVLATVPYASEMGTPAPYTQLSAMEPILRTAIESVMLLQAQPADAVAQAEEKCNQILADAGYA